jgi:PKD repeat protein
MRLYFIAFLCFIGCFKIYSQNCNVTESPFASCNCDGCGVLNEDWKLTSGATKVCEGELFELEAFVDNIGVNISYYRWQILSSDFSITYVDTIISNTNLFEFLINIGDAMNCNDIDVQGNLQLNLLVYTEECNTGEVSCHNKLGPLTVIYKPRAFFTSEPVICVDNQISFTDLSCFSETHFWDFGDGTTSTEANPTHTYASPGTYQVTLNVSNECGSDVTTNNVIVVGYPDAEIELSIDGYDICNSDYLSLILNANEWTTGPSGTFYWSINPDYININGDWCFVDTSATGNDAPCLHDSLFIENTLDSLLQLDTVHLYFKEAGQYIVTLNCSNVCGALTVMDTINVFDPVVISGLKNQNGCDEIELCYSDLNILIKGDYKSVEWIFEGGSPSSSNNLDFGCVNFDSSGTITLLVHAYDPCQDQNQTVNVNIVNTTEVTIDDPVPNIICQNASEIPLFPSASGGLYLYNGMEAPFISGDTLYPSHLNQGVYTLTYVLSDNPDCPADDTFSFEIIDSISITLGNNNTECDSVIDFNPTISASNGDIENWAWKIINVSGDTIAASNNQNPMFDLTDSGIYQIIVEVNSMACASAFDTSEIVIQENITPSIDSISNPYCQGTSPDTLIAQPPGGIWSGNGIIDPVNGVFDPGLLNAGSYLISYSTMTGACNATTTASIEIVASQDVITFDSFMCITDQPIQLNVSPDGGKFSGFGIIDSLNGLFDGMVTGPGSYNVTYEFIDLNDCEIISNINIGVDSIPSINFNDTILVCIGDDDILLENLLDINNQGVDGTLSYEGPGIVDQDEGLFNGSGFSEGFYTVLFSFNARACSYMDSFVIQLEEKPVLTLPADSTVCISDGLLTLTANINGGIWSSSNCPVENDGMVDISAIGESDCTFQYTLDAGSSCEQSDSVNITIIDLSNNLTVPEPFSLCYSNTNFTIPNFSPTDGFWTGEGIINSENGIIDISLLSQDSTYTYIYCIQSSQIDCEACKETSFTIEALPNAVFSLNNNPCQNQEFSILNQSSPNSTSFNWDFGDGSNPTSLTNPIHTYTNAGDYIITLVASTQFGCADTSVLDVHVTAPPTLDLSIITDEGCAPLEVEYVNNSSGEGIQQYWVIDQVDTIYSEQPIIVLDSVWSDSLITIELFVLNECDTLRSSKEILVHPYPIVDFGINDDEGCSPDTVYFINASQGAPDFFLWNFGNGITTSDINPQPQIYATPDDSISTYTISLYAGNSCGEDSLQKEIVVYPNNIDAFFEVDTLQGCPPLAVNIKNYATPGAKVSYDFGDGGTGVSPDTTYVFHTPGKYVITQYAALCGQDSAKSDTITIFPLPVVNFDLPAFVCVGDTVRFINLSTNAVSGEWNFGDGTKSIERNPSHHYSSRGTYDVQLIMYSTFNNCPDTLTKTILVPEPPVAEFEINPQEVCPGELVQFSNISTNALNYAWDFGDNSGSELQNPDHTYNVPGVYEVTLTVFDEYGCSADSSIANLIVHNKPESSFEVTTTSPCQFYDTVNITNTSIGQINSIYKVNDTIFSQNNNDIQLSFDVFGQQKIELISINAFGCTDTSSLYLDVLPSPIAQSNLSDTTGCQKLSLNFIDLSINSNLTKWLLDQNNTSSNKNFNHEFLNHGIYKVVLIASNTNGCRPDSLEIDVEVYPRAISDFIITPYDSCGTPKSVNFQNVSQFTTDYFWDLGNNQNSTLFEPNAIYQDTGHYAVSLISNNEFNCPDTSFKFVQLFPQPLIDISIPYLQYCEDDTIEIFNNSLNANNFTWYINDNQIEMLPIILIEQGSYSLTLVASYDQLCFDTLQATSEIEIYDSPIVNFDFFADTDEEIIGDVEFINLSTDAEEYLWTFGNGVTSTEINPVHEYNQNGPMNVCLYGYNHNNNNFLCEDEFCVNVLFETINSFFVPNALSPELNYGNPEVGIFKPKGIGIKEYELNIYSPWGDKVATLNQVLNGEPVDFWDGTFRFEPVPQGSYLWTAKVIYESGHNEFLKGNVTVIR